MDAKDADSGQDGGGPGMEYMPFVTMDDLTDKLKLLNYEKGFLYEQKRKAISKHYFSIQTNPGEQFYLFTSLSAWLIQQAGRQMAMPQEYDDPNSTISTILDHLRQMGITIDFFPNKLKTGWGEYVIFVLDRLSDLALKNKNFSWQQPTYPSEKTEEEDTEIEDEAELTLEKVEEEMMEFDDGEDPENILHIDELSDFNLKSNNQQMGNILHSNTTRESWSLEVEKMLPQLKLTIKSDIRDWRTHVKHMHDHRSKIDQTFYETKKQLESLHNDVTRSLEKVTSREKYLNTQLDELLVEFRNLQNVTAENREQYRQVSGTLMEKSHYLAQISDELDRMKQEMEEKGTSMTDGAPLVSISKALARIKEEIVAMDVRAGVVNQKILQTKLKDKSLLRKNMNAQFTAKDLGVY